MKTVGTDADSFTANKLSTSYVDLKADLRAVSAYEFDDLVEIQTRITLFSGTRILFHFESFRNDTLLNTAEVELVFVDKNTGRPCKAPEHIVRLFED
mgnify:CR=1 FL=1